MTLSFDEAIGLRYSLPLTSGASENELIELVTEEPARETAGSGTQKKADAA